MRLVVTFLAFAVLSSRATAAAPPVYLWFEPEWFEGVKGSFAYWPGPNHSKPSGSWGIAGPGISAEWTQGGESEWNSMGAPANETKAACHRNLVVPRAGKYKVWVRYVDHRKKTEPFVVMIDQKGKPALKGELGVAPVVPANDEYQLYWGFSFGWGSLATTLEQGPARLTLAIEKAGEGWRQLDAVLITDDLKYEPAGREKPPFQYLSTFDIQPKDGAAWRGNWSGEPKFQRSKVGGRDFSMWTAGLEADPKMEWWKKQDLDKLSLYDVFFQSAPPADIKDKFHKQFAGRKDVALINWKDMLPGGYLGTTPDFSPDSPVRKWLERTKTPFFILTNYANPNYSDKTGPATYAALTGPLADQFLGYIHGEALGTGGVGHVDKPLGMTRREHVDAFGKQLLKQQADAWSKIYKTPVPEAHMAKSIPCLSVDSIALAHLFHEIGCKVVGYEEDSTNVHVPMRIAFERGAARQYGSAWINYASGNFGDACNYFTQQHMNRGAQSWFHSKYAVTDGVSIGWYRKMYYLNYLSGASAIYWEQGQGNQWILPGPGTHPIQLSPFGRATEDFQAFVDRLPDRGEPYAPIAILVSHGHGFDRVNYHCKMLGQFTEDRNDLELRELFNVLWHPTAILEGKPAAPDAQSLPSGVYGNIFDVLVDRPSKAEAIFNYPIVWAAGDANLAPMRKTIEEYLNRGGTLVLNAAAARTLPDTVTGLKLQGITRTASAWWLRGEKARDAIPFEVEEVELTKAAVIARADPQLPLMTRNAVGNGAVITILVPNLIGQDERAHPALPYLMNGLTQKLLPVQVLAADGSPINGKVMYQLNRTKGGWLVTLINNQGVDKTQHGIARVDRRAHVDVILRTDLQVLAAKEYTEPRDLLPTRGDKGTEIRVRVHPGDVQAVYLTAK